VRMWLVDPERMCDRHLLGEHFEMHVFCGALVSGRSMKGYISAGLVEVSKLKSRHDELVREMENRGMKHRSPFGDELQLECAGKVDSIRSEMLLLARCESCRVRIRRKELGFL